MQSQMSQKTVHFTNNSLQTLDDCALNHSQLLPQFASFPCDSRLIRCRQSYLWAKTCSRAKKAPSAGRHWSEMRDPKNASGLQKSSSQSTRHFLLKTCHFFVYSKQHHPCVCHKLGACLCSFVMFRATHVGRLGTDRWPS